MLKLISEYFAKYLNNVYVFPNFLDDLHSKFANVRKSTAQSQHVPINFNSIKSAYPIFPYRYRYHNKLSNFDHTKIYSVYYGDSEDLYELLSQNVFDIKQTLDYIPNTLERIIFDSDLQNAFFTSLKNQFNESNQFLTRRNIDEYINFSYDLWNNVIDEDVANVEFCQQFFHFFFLNQIIPKITNFQTQFADFIVSSNICTKGYISFSFNQIFNQYEDEILKDLTNIITKNVYSIINPSENLEQQMINAINKVSISDYFDEFIRTKNMNDVANNIIYTSGEVLSHVSSLELLKSVCKSDNILREKENSSFSAIQEERIITDFINKANTQKIQPYLFCNFLYKHYSAKFINTLSILIKEYIENNIIPDDTVFPNSMRTIPGSIQKYRFEDVNFKEYENLIQQLFIPENLLKWWNEYNCTNFVFFLVFYDIIDEFIESEFFRNYYTKMLETIYTTFVEEGHIQSDFKWFSNTHLIKLYFKSLLKEKLTNGELLSTLNSYVDKRVENLLTNNYNKVTEEIVTPEASKSISYFTQYAFDEESITVYLNDVEQVKGSDYDVTGSSHRIIFYKNIQGSIITADYDIKYDFKINYLQLNIENRMNSFTQDSYTSDNFTKFVKNMYLSSVTQRMYELVRQTFEID